MTFNCEFFKFQSKACVGDGNFEGHLFPLSHPIVTKRRRTILQEITKEFCMQYFLIDIQLVKSNYYCYELYNVIQYFSLHKK